MARRLVAVPALAGLALLLAGCGLVGDPAPPSAPADPPASPTIAAPVPTVAPPTPGNRPKVCNAEFDAATGSVSSNGPDDGSISIGDSGLEFGCGGGPTVQLKVDPGRGLVATSQGNTVPVEVGSTTTVGPYRVEVVSIRAAQVTFRFTLPDG